MLPAQESANNLEAGLIKRFPLHRVGYAKTAGAPKTPGFGIFYGNSLHTVSSNGENLQA